MKFDRPIVLTSNQISLTEGQTGISDTARSQAILHAPLLIDRINFFMRSNAVSSSVLKDLGGIIGTRIRIGPHYLSSDFIPVWGHCTQNSMSNLDDNIYQPYTTPTVSAFNKWTWKLPKPMYVPSGMPLVTYWNYRDTAMLNAQAATCQIAFVGRVLADHVPPKETDIPWLARWIGLICNNGTTAATRSNESDLLNPLDKPVHVQRLIGRILRYGGNNTYEEFADATRSINAKLTDSSGYALTDDFRRWSVIFDLNRRVWNIGYDLPATKSLYVETQSFTSIYTAPLFEEAHVSLVGSRKEAI